MAFIEKFSTFGSLRILGEKVHIKISPLFLTNFENFNRNILN